jgi:glycerol uptake facilitator-like aquaporin
MKKSIPYEIVAAVSAMLGAVLLVFVYYPVINPIRYRIDSHHETAPLSRYILGTPVSLLILSGAWYFNRKAQRRKRDEKDVKHDQKPSA